MSRGLSTSDSSQSGESGSSGGVTRACTGCITAFSGVENDVENDNETTNPIGIFTVLNIDIDI